MAMDTTLNTKWLTALRSGEYPQTSFALHRVEPRSDGLPAGYCCLGVLATVAGIPEDEDGWFTFPRTYSNGTMWAKSLPTLAQFELWGIADGGFVLTDMNDNGRSFAEIADYIERNL